MNQYTLKMVYQNLDKSPISEAQREVIKNEVAHTLIQSYPFIMFELVEVKE